MDWICSVHPCKFSNFARRAVCLRCGVAREPAAGPPCPTHRAAGPAGDGKFDWNCGNCSDRGPFINSGKQKCKRCGQSPPEWVQRGLTFNEHRLEVARATEGNDPSYLEKVVKKERAAAAKAKAGGKAVGKGGEGDGPSPAMAKVEAENAKFKAKIAKLEAELKKKLGLAPGAEEPAAAKPGGGAAAADAEGTASDDPMEGDSHKAHQAQAKRAEEKVKFWTDLLARMVAEVFPDGVSDNRVERDQTTGPTHRKVHEANEELVEARRLVRSSRPLGAQIGNKRRDIATTEGKLAANEQRVRDQAAVVASLEQALKDAKDHEAELLETVRNQHERLARENEELVELRREELESEGGAVAPPPPPPVQAAGDSADAESLALRAQCQPQFLEDFVANISNPAALQALVDATVRKKALVDEDAAARAAQAEAARLAAESAAAAVAAKAAAGAGALPQPPRDVTRCTAEQAKAALQAQQKAESTPARSRSPQGRPRSSPGPGKGESADGKEE